MPTKYLLIEEEDWQMVFECIAKRFFEGHQLSNRIEKLIVDGSIKAERESTVEMGQVYYFDGNRLVPLVELPDTVLIGIERTQEGQ